MDCEEELDVYDSDYAEDYYDNDDEDYCDKVDDSDLDDDEHVFGVSNTSKSKITYTNYKEEDIRKRQEEEILHVSSILSIHDAAASKLLHYYKWNVSQLHDEWFADEAKVRDKVGLPSVSVPLSNTKELVLCGICFDHLPMEDFYPMVCGHLYCKVCWNRHITISINDGPGCLLLRCPEPCCSVAVCRDMVDDLVAEEERRKYSRYFLRSFVEEGKKIKWCPAPGCENAVELELGDSVFDVTCLCSYAFCWNCGEEAHRPVKCDTVAKWVLKNSSESENTAWIIANSKSCPKCGRPIEKNQGCMHMTCTWPCRFEFCWLCLGDWKSHNTKDGFYKCNKFEADKNEGKYDEEERIRRMAKNSVQKYTHYYERWASNQKSRNKAIQALQDVQSNSLKKLSDWTKEPESQLKFITDAWKQIIECRRVLKWTYAYGYYIPEDDAHKQFFEYSQGEAESNLERLHKCAERDFNALLEHYLPPESSDNNPPTEAEFKIFRKKLMDLTNVTHSYFTKLVAYLEKSVKEQKQQQGHKAHSSLA